MAYLRGGSTLAGELLAAHPHTFYLFEPAYTSHIDWYKSYSSLLNNDTLVFLLFYSYTMLLLLLLLLVQLVIKLMADDPTIAISLCVDEMCDVNTIMLTLKIDVKMWVVCH